ncbi:MAG: response regulator transcription factor [Bacteroidales bacterium]
MKILIIEDEKELREILVSFLERERYIVEAVGNIKDAITKVGCYTYDCILLDIMLPDGNGLSFLSEIKRGGNKENIIIISAKDSIEDKVEGLDLGADDYLSKPFHLAELHARIKSLIRRNQQKGRECIVYGNVSVDPSSFEVMISGSSVELNRKEYDILHYLLNRPEMVINKEMLAEAVWGDHIDQVDNFDFIYAQIKNLRKKLNDSNSNLLIKAVYGFGYKLTNKG